MKSFWPSKKQWARWTLPSKLTAIGCVLGVLSLFVTLIITFKSCPTTRHVNCSQSNAGCPLELAAFSYEEPHATDVEYNGIKWRDNYVDVRVVLTSQCVETIQDINLTIQPDIQIVDIHQVTTIPGVVLAPGNPTGVEVLAGKIVVVDKSGKRLSIPADFSGTGVSAPLYNLSSPMLLSRGKIEIVMACAALNPMEKDGSFPRQLYAKRRNASWIRISGSYDVREGITLTRYQIKSELPLTK